MRTQFCRARGASTIVCRALLALLTAVGSGCGSPLEPGECRNGRDSLGRSSFRTLRAVCGSSGAAVQCRTEITEGGYCAGPTRDVTNAARWISTDSPVATFSTPGVLQFRSAGATTIYAEAEALYSQEAFAYIVEADGTPRQIGVVDVFVWDTTTGGFLPRARVEFTSRTGVAQSCEQGFGAPYAPCRFWSDSSPGTIRASLPGYSTVEVGVAPSPTNLSIPTYVVVRLRSSL
jgi:hypothetical protein